MLTEQAFDERLALDTEKRNVLYRNCNMPGTSKANLNTHRICSVSHLVLPLAILLEKAEER